MCQPQPPFTGGTEGKNPGLSWGLQIHPQQPLHHSCQTATLTPTAASPARLSPDHSHILGSTSSTALKQPPTAAPPARRPRPLCAGAGARNPGWTLGGLQSPWTAPSGRPLEVTRQAMQCSACCQPPDRTPATSPTAPSRAPPRRCGACACWQSLWSGSADIQLCAWFRGCAPAGWLWRGGSCRPFGLLAMSRILLPRHMAQPVQLAQCW